MLQWRPTPVPGYQLSLGPACKRLPADAFVDRQHLTNREHHACVGRCVADSRSAPGGQFASHPTLRCYSSLSNLRASVLNRYFVPFVAGLRCALMHSLHDAALRSSLVVQTTWRAHRQRIEQLVRFALSRYSACLFVCLAPARCSFRLAQACWYVPRACPDHHLGCFSTADMLHLSCGQVLAAVAGSVVGAAKCSSGYHVYSIPVPHPVLRRHSPRSAARVVQRC